MKIFGCHGNELPIKEILYQSVFGDKYYMIGHKFTISVTMDVSPFAWCLARAVLKTSGVGLEKFEHSAYQPRVQTPSSGPGKYFKMHEKNMCHPYIICPFRQKRLYCIALSARLSVHLSVNDLQNFFMILYRNVY